MARPPLPAPGSGSSDAAGVRRLLDGDREAGDLLFRRHAPALRRVAERSLGRGFGPADAENVVQQAWLMLLEDGGRRLGRYDPSRSLPPFLIGVVLNACRNYRRDESRRRPGVPDVSGVALAGPPSESPEVAEDVRKALEGLESRERVLLNLIDVQGLGRREVARILGVAEGSVGTLLARARERLREALRKRGFPS